MRRKNGDEITTPHFVKNNNVMAKPPDDYMDMDTDLQDRIRPEDSVSNLSRRGSITSSIVWSVKERRTAAAKKLFALREESALAEIEAKMKRK